MATFHSLTPPMGSRQNRQAPDMLSVELELALPQDHFLPAEDIQAQVWTNIIHKLNPDGPEVWAAIPMKLSHVIQGKSVAVFAARFQPTGRGDFGLTARWKSHKQMTEWQWAPANTESTDGVTGGSNGITDSEPSKDVSISVRVPRNFASSSSWTIGPQSVMIYGQDGPRVEGYGRGSSLGGPGLYLGNHAAATRARISGYESVLSLVGDLLDFDEKIPENDRELNKSLFKDQSDNQPKRFSSISRSSSVTSYGVSMSESANGGENGNGLNGSGSQKGLGRRSSVAEFMVKYEPGRTDKDISGIVDEPVDPPRLGRKSSVSDMMVKAPVSSKRSNRSSVIQSTEETMEAKPNTATTNPAPTPPTTQAKNGATPAQAAATVESKSTIPTPPVSISKGSSKKKKKEAAAAAAAASSDALPPVITSKSAKASSTLQSNSLASPTITSLEISPALDPNPPNALTSRDGLSSDNASGSANGAETSGPPSSAKVVSGLSRQSWESHNALSSLSNLGSASTSASSTNLAGLSLSDSFEESKKPFQHKVISMAPGAHSVISDAALKEAVEFLKIQVGQGKKVLVHCRDGNGRSGSVAAAFIATQLDKNARRGGRYDTTNGEGLGAGRYYDDALKEVWKWKCDVYPHKGLRQSLEKIKL